MIITDGIHLVSTESEEELHDFARKIGLKRRWYQSNNYHPHYDLTTAKALWRALMAGAISVSSRDLVLNAWWSANINKRIREAAAQMAMPGF